MTPNQTKDMDYKLLSFEEIWTLIGTEILTHAAPRHCIFMWSPDAMLHHVEEWAKLNGYRRHVRFVWDKRNGVAPAFTIRYTHEYLVWYYKPTLAPIDPAMRGKYPSVFHEPPREHSRKPEYAYTMIDALYPTAAKIDVFSRQPRPGWKQFGDETDKFS